MQTSTGNLVSETDQIPSVCTYNDGFNNHIRTTPLLDILSVSVHSSEECRKEKAFDIYGNIQLIDDEQNHSYDMFCRTRENPQTVLSGCHLLLANPKGICSYLYVPSVSSLKMCVDLKDAATNGNVVAKGDFDLQLLDHRKDGFHERVVTQIVGGGCDGSFASLKYATLPHAVLATLNLTFIKLLFQPSHALVYGCISATSKVRKGDVISSVVLNKTPCEPLLLKVGEPIQLSRPILAVPAYSSFEIRADLWDYHTNQQIASGVILTDILAQDESGQDWTVSHETVFRQTNHIRVQVCWNNAYVPQIEPNQQSLSALSYRGSFVAKDWLLTSSSPIRPSWSGSPMVEVFSITISPDSDFNSRFCGTIEVSDNKTVRDKRNPFVMFKHSESGAVTLTSDMKIKSLKWPDTPLDGESFSMRLRLSDNKGNEVCSGCIAWDSSAITSPVSWYGKLISSVIRGEHGYATVHYAMFPRAVLAHVCVNFKPNNSSSEYEYMVVGNITARYSCFTYSSELEKKFFQVSLITHNHRPQMYPGDYYMIGLERREVAVPVHSALILDMNLHFGVMGQTKEGASFSKYYGSLNKVVDFKFNVINKLYTKTLAGEGFDIQVCVYWKDVDQHKKLKHYTSLESDLLSRCI